MGKNNSYISAFHFAVAFVGLDKYMDEAHSGGDNPIDMSFSEVSGLNAELQTEEVSEGGNNKFSYRLPKPAKYGNLILKRALSTAPSAIVKWANEAIYDFSFHPCTVVVTLLNEEHKPVKAWSFNNAYPVKLNVSNLDANKNELVIETMELAYNYSKRVI